MIPNRDDNEDAFLTPLIPVKDWKWVLWEVTYHKGENGPVLNRRYLVSTETHVAGEVCDGGDWPTGIEVDYAKWEPIARDVREPRSVGMFYGRPISESGWAAGNREAAKLGLIS